MSNTAEIRVTTGTAGARPGRPSEGRGPAEGEPRSSAFEAVLAEMRPASGGPDRKGGVAMRALLAEAGAPMPEAAEGGGASDGALASAAGEPGKGQGGAPEIVVVTLDAARQGRGLAAPLAERIAALLEGPATNAASADGPAAGAQGTQGGQGRSLAVANHLATAVSMARGTGTETAPDVSVLRRETHFAPVVGDAGSRSTGRPEGGSEGRSDARAGGPLPGSADAGKAALAPRTLLAGLDTSPRTGHDADAPRHERAASQGGRATQIMMPGAAPDHARAAQAKAFDAAAGAALRAGETRSGGADGVGGGVGGGSGGAPGGTALQGGAAPDGGALRFADTPESAARQVVRPGAVSTVPGAVQGAAGPVKVLHIQLQPVELGTLEVRLRLTDAGLHVRIEASRPETAALLRNDHEALANVLRGAGHAVDAVTVSVSDRSGPQGQSAQDGWHAPASGARTDGQSGSGREQGGRTDQGSAARPENGTATTQVNDDDDNAALSGRRRGDLYL